MYIGVGVAKGVNRDMTGVRLNKSMSSLSCYTYKVKVVFCTHCLLKNPTIILENTGDHAV